MGSFREAVFAFAADEGRSFAARRGELLQRPRALDSPLFLFTDGAAQAFVDAPDGSRQTLRLGYPGEMLGALPGLFLDVATPIGIEALRACAGYVVTATQLRAFVASSPARAAAYTSMLEGFACGLMARELDLLEPSPARRYATVLERSPQLFAHVPLRYIASYLRMTPETLSRVRRRATAKT